MRLGQALARGCAILILGSAALGASAAPVATDKFQIFLPAFGGDRQIGLNVATVVNLRIWRTLRKAPSPNPSNLNFGDGTVVWDVNPLREPAMNVAGKALRFTNSDIVLWGSAERYGNGVIAGTYLLVRPLTEADAPRGALWRIRVGNESIDLGLPRHLFEFGTMVLRPEVVEAYSQPSALTLCQTRTTACAGNPLGPSYRATQHEGDWTHVVSRTGGSGWVHLEELGEEPNETVEFTGGLTSYFRGDLVQAEKLFAKSANTAAADSIVRQDAKILQSASRSRLGLPAAGQIDAILREDPYSRYALQVAVMDALQNRSNATGAQSRLRKLAGNVRESRELFEPDDPWPKRAEAIFASLGL